MEVDLGVDLDLSFELVVDLVSVDSGLKWMTSVRPFLGVDMVEVCISTARESYLFLNFTDYRRCIY